MRRTPTLFAVSALMVAIAVMLFVAFGSANANLARSADLTYAQLRFLDFYVPLKLAPRELADRVRALPGVEAVSGRLAIRVRLPLGVEPHVRLTSGIVMGVPADGRPEVNDVRIEDGSYLAARQGEILVEKRFALANGLKVGDRVTLERDRLRMSLRIAGLVSSPEYVWIADSRMDPRPIARRFAALFVSDRDARALVGHDAINEIHVRVRKGEDKRAVMAATKRCLEGYLEGPPIPREDQSSNALLERDRRAFRAVAVLFPLLFLLLSTVMLLVALSQLVTTQRRQIGVLLAQGCSHAQVGIHYVTMSLLVSAAGALTGTLGGHWLGVACTRFYTRILGVPFMVTDVHWDWILVATASTVAVSLAAGAAATSHLLGLSTVELLRADFTPFARVPRLERWLPALGGAGFLVRMPLRNLLRQPARNALIALGIALAVALLLMTFALFDTQSTALAFFFEDVHTYDLSVTVQPTSAASLPPIAHWPGVSRVESYLIRRAAITSAAAKVVRHVWGVPAGARLLGSYDADHRRLEESDDGPIYLSPPNARDLSARSDDCVSLSLESGDPQVPRIRCRVGPELYDPVSTPPRMPLRQLQKLVAQSEHTPGDVVNVLLIKVAPGALDAVRRRLAGCRWVSLVTDVGQLREDVDDLLRMADAYFTLMAGFAAVLAFALVAGGTSVSVMERIREVSIMSVLGVHDGMVCGMLVIEALVLWLVGLLLGIPGGWFMGNWLLNHYDNDLIQLSMQLRVSTVCAAAAASLAICVAALGFALRLVLRTPPAAVCAEAG